MHGGMAATTTGGYTGTGSPLDIQQYMYQLNSLLPAAAGREQLHNCQHSMATTSSSPKRNYQSLPPLSEGPFLPSTDHRPPSFIRVLTVIHAHLLCVCPATYAAAATLGGYHT